MVIVPIKVVGSRLQQARKNAGLKQKQVAFACGVVWPTVSMWEGGHRAPNWEAMQIMCSMYGMTMGELFAPDEANMDRKVA